MSFKCTCINEYENRVYVDFRMMLFNLLFDAKRWIGANPTMYCNEEIKKMYEYMMFIDENLLKNFYQELFNNNEKKINFFLAKRGYGKTTFINYFLNKYTSIMNKNNISWIRLDMSKIYNLHQELVVYSNDISIENYFYIQLLYVFLRYRNNEYKPFIYSFKNEKKTYEKQCYDKFFMKFNGFENYLKDIYSKEKYIDIFEEVKEKIFEIENFYDYDKKDLLNNKNYIIIGKKLFEYIKNRNVINKFNGKILLIIDGIDNVSYTESIRKEMYSQLECFLKEFSKENFIKILILAREEFSSEFVLKKPTIGYPNKINVNSKFFFYRNSKTNQNDSDKYEIKRKFFNKKVNEENIVLLENTKFNIEEYFKKLIVFIDSQELPENTNEEKFIKDFEDTFIDSLKSYVNNIARDIDELENYIENYSIEKFFDSKLKQRYEGNVSSVKKVLEKCKDISFECISNSLKKYQYLKNPEKVIDEIKETFFQDSHENLELNHIVNFIVSRIDNDLFEYYNNKLKMIRNYKVKIFALTNFLQKKFNDEQKKIFLDNTIFFSDIRLLKHLKKYYKRKFEDPFAFEKQLALYLKLKDKDKFIVSFNTFIQKYQENILDAFRNKKLSKIKYNDNYFEWNEFINILNINDLFYYDIREMLVVLIKSYTYYLQCYYYIKNPRNIEINIKNKINKKVLLNAYFKGGNMYCTCKKEIYFLPPYRNIHLINIFNIFNEEELSYSPLLYLFFLNYIENYNVKYEINKETNHETFDNKIFFNLFAEFLNRSTHSIDEIINTFLEYGYIKIRSNKLYLTKKGVLIKNTIFTDIYNLHSNIYNGAILNKYSKYIRKFKRDFSDHISVMLLNVLLKLLSVKNELKNFENFDKKINFNDVLSQIKDEILEHYQHILQHKKNTDIKKIFEFNIFKEIENEEIILEIKLLVEEINNNSHQSLSKELLNKLENLSFNIIFESEEFDVGDILVIFSQYKGYTHDMFDREAIKLYKRYKKNNERNNKLIRKYDELMDLIEDENEFENAKKRFTYEKLINGDLNERLKKFLEKYNNSSN